MGKIVTFGELLLRLSPEGYSRFLQTQKFEKLFGGTEANVSILLANLGLNTSFVTKLPSHEIGQLAINSIRQFGVDTTEIVRGDGRIGIYFCEKGAGCRGGKVIYDRANSAIAEAKENDFDWNKIFEGASWFHFTGITPALSDNVAKITEIACIEAKKRGLRISCDLNYRAKLWTKEKANKVMSNLVKYVDVLISNTPQVFDVLKLKADTSEELAKILCKNYNFKYIAFTDRTMHSATNHTYCGLLYDRNIFYYSKNYNLDIIDRVGGGDAFCAGLIYGMALNFDYQKTIEFATAAAAIKHTVEGDFLLATVDEINELAFGTNSLYIKR